MISSQTGLLIRDEFAGFAKSKVMIVLWVALPALTTIGFLLLSSSDSGAQLDDLPLTHLMGLLVSSLAGTIAAVMLSVDLVNERQRRVYDLFLIRPLRPESILWAKFVAVFACVTIACVISIAVGIAVDLARGVELSSTLLETAGESLGSVTGVIAISAAVGVFVGVVSSSILVAVILILYVGQNLTVIPMLPTYFGLGDYYWTVLAITAAVTVAVVYFAGVLFRRQEP